MSRTSKISPALFVLSILSFFFIFVTVSCQGHDLASFTGLQLATGAKIQQPKIFGQSQEREIPPEPYAAFALLCAVVGAGIGFARRTAAIPAISGIAGAVSLLILKSHVTREIMTRGEGLFQVTYGPGFFMAILLMIAAATWNAYLFSQRAKTSVPDQPIEPPRSLAGENSTREG